MNTVLRVLIASTVLFLLESAYHPGWVEAVSALLICAVLCWITACSRASGSELLIALAGIYFIPSMLINIPEGVLFDVIKIGQAPLILARGLGVSLLIALTIVALFRRFEAAPGLNLNPISELPVLGFVWRLVAAVFLFIICYFAAGILIYPLVKDYYEVRTMPEPEAIVCMQILRAVALLAAARLVLRGVPRPRDARLILAMAFPVIGCIAVMLPANDLMPPAMTPR